MSSLAAQNNSCHRRLLRGQTNIRRRTNTHFACCRLRAAAKGMNSILRSVFFFGKVYDYNDPLKEEHKLKINLKKNLKSMATSGKLR